MAKCAVFASGRGTNFRAIYDRILDSPHSIAVLVSDKPDCGAVEFARTKGIPTLHMKYSRDSSREAVETLALAELSKYPGICLGVLAGFMRILTPNFLKNFPGRIVNIHPSLLPSFPGKDGLRQSIESNDESLGITIHFVDEGVDTGPVIVQESFLRENGQSAQELERIIHSIEHRLYPKVVLTLLDKAVEPT